MPSTRAINYSVRANKHIERRLLFEVLRRLDRLPPRLGSYRYVGFGGIFFADFLLAHRDLGIDNLVSVEQAPTRDRFTFNKPLACIDLQFGSSGELLPPLLAESRTGPTIYWLDYDGALDQAVLDDITHVATAASAWTVMLLTVNCQPEPLNERLAILRQRLGDLLPPDITSAADLGSWKLAGLSHRLITGAIDAALVDRNAALPPEERMRYRQLVHFHYADGAKMLTTGGIFHASSGAEALEEATRALTTTTRTYR